MRLLALLFCFVLSTSAVFAANSEIFLKDGSVISGEVLSFDGSVYRVRSSSLGVIELKSSSIKSIRLAGAGSAGGSAGSGLQSIGGIQQRLAADPEIMRLIMSLQNDPQLLALLSDPRVLQAIVSGNTDALKDNPALSALMNNPAIKEILEKAQRK